VKFMNKEIELGGQKIPQSDWDATPERVQQLVLNLLEQLKGVDSKQEEFGNRVAELEEQQRQNSQNSSQPPSKDKPWEKSGQGNQSKRAKRNVFGFKNSKIKGKRELYPPEACQAIHEEKPAVCRICGEPLSGEDAQPYRHQIADVPEIKPEVTEYRLHELECPHCGAKTRAKLPVGVSERCYGPRLAGWISLMSGDYRQSHRKIAGLLQEGFGIALSRTTINRARQEVSQSVAAPVEAAQGYVLQNPVVNCDETGFNQGNQDGLNPNRSRGWLWVLVTPLVVFFTVTLSRSQAAAKQLLGEDFGGYLGTDRYSSYGWIAPIRRQVCWAHLLRDFQAIAERPGVSGEIGEALLRRGYRLFHWWHRVRDGTLSEELFRQAVVLLRVGLVAELQAAADLPIAPREKTPLAKTVRTCTKILTLETALWTFVYIPGIEPTNNLAEQALRPAVIWQYTSFGSQSQAGSEFVARMLTVNATLKAQNRSVLEFLTQSCQAARLGFEPPSLLPIQHSTQNA
jgi:transposase